MYKNLYSVQIILHPYKKPQEIFIYFFLFNPSRSCLKFSFVCETLEKPTHFFSIVYISLNKKIINNTFLDLKVKNVAIQKKSFTSA